MYEISYNVDVVMCIDKTGNMRLFIENLTENFHNLWMNLVDAMDMNGRCIEQLRFKFIAFGDFRCDEDPIMESRFLSLPEDENEALCFLTNISCGGGGDIPEDALEAFSLALKTDWDNDAEVRHRHIVMMFTDAPAHKLGTNSEAPFYPDGMPADLGQLSEWWHGGGAELEGSFMPRFGRLALFAPKEEPWIEMQKWCHSFVSYKDNCSDLYDMDVLEELQPFFDFL